MNNIKKTIHSKTGTTLSLSLRFLEKPKREALYTLFAWAKHLEEVAESSLDDAEKKMIMDGWRQELDNIFDKKVPASEIGRQIYKNCLRFKLPKAEFINTLESISQNISQPWQAPSLKQFNGYCRGFGGIAGSLSLRVFGCKDENIISNLSSSMGKALQITNILRNIKEDANNNRLFIPQEMLAKAEINSTDPQAVLVNKNLVIARKELAQIAEDNYQKAYDIIASLDKKTSKPLLLILDTYKKYFDIMNKRGWEIISPKPEISRLGKLQVLAKVLFAS